MFKLILKLKLVILLIISLLSCVSTTHIRAINPKTSTTDQNVKIYVDGQYKGNGSVNYSDTKIIASTTNIDFKKEGCRTKKYFMSRSEKVNVGVLIGGIFFWPLLLWMMEYNSSRDYEFDCDK